MNLKTLIISQAALRVGAELLYLATADEAMIPIKSYSPELMVTGVYCHAKITSTDSTITAAEICRMCDRVTALLPRLHA